MSTHVPFDRFPLQSQTAYTELLEALRTDELQGLHADRGSLTQREVKGNTYWYLRRRVGERIEEVYLGPDSEDLHRRLETIRQRASDAKSAAARRRTLIRMLRAAGYPTVPRRHGRLFEELSGAGVFRLEAVLVGTHAFRCMSAVLGVRFDDALATTGDLAIAQDRSVSIAVAEKASPPLLEAIARAERFVDIPSLDPRSPTTSWQTPDHELRVDVLTPLVGRDGSPAEKLTALGVHATPLRFLDFLLAETQPAVVLSGAGILVRVPTPERFALHKLIVASRRDRAFRDKAQKDLDQARLLLEILLEDQPADVADAWSDLASRGGRWRRAAEESGRGLPEGLWGRVLQVAG